MRLFLFLLFLVLIFSSCNNINIYTEKREVRDGIWKYADSLSYSFEIKDTAQLYTMQLNVEHDDKLPYENCYVKINSVYPDKTRKSDILSLEFADETGTWMGKREGSHYVAPIALQPIAKFNKAGNYQMVFYQNSRVDSLSGIHSLELVIDKKKD